jgi:hypothetical protein
MSMSITSLHQFWCKRVMGRSMPHELWVKSSRGNQNNNYLELNGALVAPILLWHNLLQMKSPR